MAGEWRDQLLPATYFGITFQVDSHSSAGGRRGELIEYPQRDMPFFDDTGLKSKRYTFTAYLIGEDYRFDLRLLIEALESPIPGPLSHPTLGLVSAVCTDYTYTEGTDDGLMARLDLTFVESGLPVFPGVADAVLSAVQTASETLEAAAAVDFADVLEVIGKPGKVLTRAIANVTATVTNATDVLLAPGKLIADQVGDIATGLQRLVDATAALLAVPEDFVAQWSGIIDAITDRATAQALAESMALSATVDTTSTPTEQTIATNEIALYALPRRLALARACELVASEEIEVYDDARAVRAALLGLIDAELAVAPLLDDDLTQALQDLRVQTAKAIDAVAGAAVRLRTFTPPDVLPACVLAVQLYGDATRADELVARNNIAHPGFVLVGPLRVLAS